MAARLWDLVLGKEIIGGLEFLDMNFCKCLMRNSVNFFLEFLGTFCKFFS